MHHIKEVKHIAHFVALQSANEMPFHPMLSELADFVTGFLQIVFTENGHSGCNGGPDACSVAFVRECG